MRAPLLAFLTALSIPSSAAAQAPQPAPELRLPEPTAPEPLLIKEQGESPVHYRRSPRIVLPLMRVGLGYHGRIATGGFEEGGAFSFDLYGGAAVRFGRGARTGLVTEIGYSYVSFSEHLVSLGLGVLHGIGPPAAPQPGEPADPPGFRIALVPHAIAGHAYGGRAVGARTSVILGHWFYAIELSHQILQAAPGQAHEIHVMFTSTTLFGERE